MKKLLSLIFVSLLLSGNAYAFCIFGNCEAKEACRDYAKSADGDQDGMAPKTPTAKVPHIPHTK